MGAAGSLAGLGVGAGGGGGAAAASTYLTFANYTALAGTVTDGGSNTLNLAIAADATVWTSGGLDDALGGGYWTIPAANIAGNINLLLEWVARVNQSMVTVGVHKAASAPTSLADLNSANCHFLQTTQASGGGVSTYVKNGTNNFTSGNAENGANSVRIGYTVGCSAAGYGGAVSVHEYNSGSNQISKEHSTEYTATGNVYVVITWSIWNAAARDNTVQVKLNRPENAL